MQYLPHPLSSMSFQSWRVLNLFYYIIFLEMAIYVVILAPALLPFFFPPVSQGRQLRMSLGTV